MTKTDEFGSGNHAVVTRVFATMPLGLLRVRSGISTGAEAHTDSTCLTRPWKGRSSTVVRAFVVGGRAFIVVVRALLL